MMPSKLQLELKQSKPFGSLKQEVLINLVRTAAVVLHQSEVYLRTQGLTFLQYNVLRIIRGAGVAGIAQCDIRDRLVTPSGDVSRVLVRLEKTKLVRRSSDETDGRVLTVCLTQTGAALLQAMDKRFKELEEQLFLGLDDSQLRVFNWLLAEAR